jgi:hypothetical protein
VPEVPEVTKVPSVPISNRALNRATLARQMLLARAKTTALDAIERLAGMQAQVARPPFIGLWTRLAKFDRADLLVLIHTKKVVRVTAMRATLHLMTAGDYVKLRGALQPALTRGLMAIAKSRNTAIDLDRIGAEGRAFFGKRPAPFDAMRDVLKRKFPTADERALGYVIRCSVPLVQVPDESRWGFPAACDFALADTWLGRTVPAGDAPAHALVMRYLAAFGPASVADAQAWSALRGLREVFEELRPKLVTLYDGRNRELFDLPDAPRPDPDTPAPVRFLPDFDNLILSHDDRTRVVAAEHRPFITTKNLLVPGTFLVDGMVAGTWKIERKKQTATLAIQPFGKLAKKAQAELDAEGQALLTFVEPDAGTREVQVKPG